MENSIQAIMSSKVETIDIIDSAKNAAQTMKEKKISSIIVVDMKKNPDEPLGIVTEKDFVHKICAQGANSKDIAIGEIMSSPIATTTPSATIEGAADLMLHNKVRHLLVVDKDKKPIGIVAPTDLNKYLRSNLDMNEVNARILKAMLEEEEMSESAL
ncbi:MAG TPA: CBS domain-containing protein [Nitrososphaera sp.]|nr:CBS domain-containing protein [Nitrososphaera sp.]